MTDETDAALVARLRRGDRAAAGALAERHLRACRAVALAVTASEDDADDVCQDAFVAAIEQIDRCRRPERFGAWLMQIARNRARDRLRAGRRGTVALDAVEVASVRPSPAADAERKDARARLLAAIATLPEARREVLLLHDLEGWTHREIAERLELPPGTVRSHLHHARRRVRALLPELEEDTHG